ncbi:DUF1877 domain-containing protein [Dietzia sp. B44]|uniref:DUF1877 domain-containing protein n=1 Tax=Dietzia TaxID=37914 RepID=UPI0015CB1C9F|nr:DUF1877 domain-containing protein [Dietzia sp. B44]MBB1053199.1 DUF1877 domain-containing protein [Dietzia sp. B44]
MGIRYYAYAFDAEITQAVLSDPRAHISPDPFADAVGLPHGFTMGTTDFQQGPAEEDMLYLDKAWRNLQRMSEPSDPAEEPRPAYRMFEGEVTPLDGWEAWLPWVRAIPPGDVALIADDLDAITRADFVPWFTRHNSDSVGEVESEAQYVKFHLGRARRFLRALEKSGRGFAYMIG